MDKINENIEKIKENEEKIEINQPVNVVEDKIETKGLKLKKSTKDRLNMLQSNFDDAESMIVTLLNQYDNFKIESSEKFSDRKGEIDRFNFLIDSLKGCFVNSLEMATYLEDKYAVKLKNEMKKKDKIISILQEENTELKRKNKENDEGINQKNKELNDVKDSFSRVNIALTTVEKELKEKSDIIQNLQRHINSLTEISHDNKRINNENDKLKDEIKELKEKLTNESINYEKVNYLKSENERFKNEIINLTEEKKEYKEYSNSLNERIQEVLLNKSIEIAKINEEKNNLIREIESKKEIELKNANDIINSLKDEIFELKLNLNKINFDANK